MSENLPAVAEIQARLQDITRLLRQTGSLDGEARGTLAELVEELTQALAAENLPAAELSHLADTTAHLAETLHHQQDLGVVGKARKRLQRTLTSAEASAPIAVGLARKLLDALANIGI
jgi:hypothetical protein